MELHGGDECRNTLWRFQPWWSKFYFHPLQRAPRFLSSKVCRLPFFLFKILLWVSAEIGILLLSSLQWIRLVTSRVYSRFCTEVKPYFISKESLILNVAFHKVWGDVSLLVQPLFRACLPICTNNWQLINNSVGALKANWGKTTSVQQGEQSICSSIMLKVSKQI